MASIADMGEEGYLMTYEVLAPASSGIRDVQIFYKTTKDLDNRGDVSNYGKPLKSLDG